MSTAHSNWFHVVACIGAVILWLTDCQDASSKLPQSGAGANQVNQLDNDLAGIAQETGLSFPDGTRLVGVNRDQGIDAILEAKVELPQSRLDEFLAASPIKPSTFRHRGDLFGSGNAFWDPARASSLRSAQTLVGSKVLNLAIDEPVDGKVSVLIVFHGT